MVARKRTASPLSFVAAAVLLAAPSGVGAQYRLQAPSSRPLVDPDHKRMQPDAADTGRNLLVFGDPNNAGMYIIRNHFAPGHMRRPHVRDQDRYVPVIVGTVVDGEEDNFEPERTVAIQPGGLRFHPAGYHHYDGANDEEVIVPITCMGPMKTSQTEAK